MVVQLTLNQFAMVRFHLSLPCFTVSMPEWSIGVDCKSIVRRFESDSELQFNDPFVQSVRTPGFQPDNSGSNPLWVTTHHKLI